MSKYFYAFPQTHHNKILVTDITKRVQLPKNLEQDPYLFLPYTVQHDDRPETVAHHYYGSVEYVWLIYFANNIIDPYTDWVMDSNTFNNYLIKKYATLSDKSGYEVIQWTMNNTIEENILYYQNVLDGTKINKDTYALSSDIEATDWTPIRIYDEEFARNEDKRVVQLVNKEYKSILKNSLEQALKE